MFKGMSEGDHLLLVATTTGYQLRMFEQAAARLGVRLTLATDRCHVLEDPWGDGAVAVRFEDPFASLKPLLAVQNKRGRFDGVLALADQAAFLAALAADRAGVAFHKPHAVEAATSKYLTRERLRAHGLLTPDYRRLALDGSREAVEEAAATARYPCVLKPLQLCASRGVIRADNAAEFLSACKKINDLLRRPEIARRCDPEDRFLQVEEYIPGEEFALEGIVTGGILHEVALFDKPDPLEGPYFEESIYLTPSRKPAALRAQFHSAVQQGIEALRLTDGPVHAEFRYNTRGVWILEIAPRPIGGLCSKAIRFTGGVSYEEFLLRCSLGAPARSFALEEGASGVMMIPVPKAGVFRGVTGVEEAQTVRYIEDVLITAKPGQSLMPYPEANTYPGFLFARAETPDAVETALRQAHAKLQFDIATQLL